MTILSVKHLDIKFGVCVCACVFSELVTVFNMVEYFIFSS